MNDIYFTLNGYKSRDNNIITYAMEDYLEMIYRISIDKTSIHLKEISNNLNVRYSSTSKMLNRLKELGFLSYKKYGTITLTEKGIKIAKYLFNRHNTLVIFFKMINKDDYKLEQVEKIEHFIDAITVNNIEKFVKKNN